MWSSTFVLRTPYVSFSFIVPSETLQEVDGGHVNAETQVESKETTTESGNLTPKIEPNSHTETAGGLPGGTTNEMKADEEKANEANPEITLKCHIKCESEANIELDSHPAEQIKEEPQMMKEEEAEASEVAPEQLPSVKQELNNPSLQSLASSPKREPENDGEEARVPKRTASTSTQTYGKECKEEADTAMPGKRKASGSSDQEVGSKRPRLCPGVETEPLMKPSGDQTGMDHRNATEKVLFKDVPPTTAQIDEGLTALIECHCEPHAPIYLCTCCCLKIPEEKIVLHIIGFEHQKDYLVVELTPDMYSEMVWQSYDVALEKIQAYQNTLLRSPPAPQVVTCEPDGLRPSEAQQPSTSVGPSPTSSTAFLASGTGKSILCNKLRTRQHLHPHSKVAQTVKGSGTDTTQSTVTSKSVVAKIAIPAKTPVEKCIPAPSIEPVVPSLSLSPSQSRVTVAKPPVTTPKSIPSTINTEKIVSKEVNASKSANPLRAATSSKNAAPTGDKGRTSHDAQQPSTSVGLSPTSSTAFPASGTGKSTLVTPQNKVQQTENKATSAPTLKSGATVKASGTNATQSTVTSKSVVAKIAIPAKTPVEKCIPALSIEPVVPSLSLSPSQSRVIVAKPPVTTPKSIPSTIYTEKIVSKEVNASKSANPLRAATSSKKAAPTGDKGRTNHDTQQPSTSVGLSPTSSTAFLPSGTGKSILVTPQTKVQQTENKATSAPTLKSGATFKGSGTNATQSIVTSKSVVAKIAIPAKTPVEKFIPAPSIEPVVPSLSLSPPQSRVTVAKPPVTTPKSIPSTKYTGKIVSKEVNASKSANLLRAATSSKKAAPTGDKGRTNHDTQQPSTSVGLSPTTTTAFLASGTGKSTLVTPQTKVQQTENKATSAPTLKSGATVKGSGTNATQSTVTSKSVVAKIAIPAKTPVEKFIPAPSIEPVVPSLSLSPSQSRVTVAKPPVTTTKSIPSTIYTGKIVSKEVNASKSANPLIAATSSKNAAPTGDKGQTNHDAQQPSTSVDLSPISTPASLANGTGKTTHVTPKIKAQQSGWLEKKATSAPTLKSGATVKVSHTDATTQNTLTSKPPSTMNTLTIVSKGVNGSKSVNPLTAVAVSKNTGPTADKGRTNHDAQQLSEAQQLSSVGQSPTSTTASLASGTGKTTLVTPQTKAQQTENKATSAPTLKSGATMKGSGTDATQSTVTSKSVVAKIAIPAKTPVEKFTPAPSIELVAPTLSLSPSQSRVTVAKPPITTPKSIPSTTYMGKIVSKEVNTSKSANPLRAATSSKNAAPTGDKGRTNHDAQQPSTSVDLSPISTPASLASGTGKETHVTPNIKAQQTGWLEKKATSAPTLKSGATVKVSHTDATAQNKVTSKPPSTMNTLTIVSKGVNTSKSANPLRSVTSSKNAAPTGDKGRTNHDTGTGHNSTATRHSASPTDGPLLSKPPGEQSTASTEQGSGATSPTTPVYGTPTFPPNHMAVADSNKDKSYKNQPIVGTDLLVKVTCEKRRQFYCLLCSIRLKNKDHMTSNSHRYKYMKLRYPDWMEGMSEMDEKMMLKMVTCLAEIEKAKRVISKTVKVNSEHYNRLATISAEEALAEVKELVESQSHSSTGTPEAESPKCVPGSDGASRSADEEESVEVLHPIATGLPITHALPSLPSALEEPMRCITRHHPAPPREPSPKSPTAAMGRPSSANSKQNEESPPEHVPKGLAFVFECHGISEDTFYLCGSCSKTFTLKLMCQHMVSTEHQCNYMLQNYPQFMSWWGRDFSPEKKEVLLRDIASKISHRELYDKMDAQVILLRKDCYDFIRTAPFSEALDMLQNISREKKLNSLFGYQKQLESPLGPIRVLQDTVNGEPTLPMVGMCIVECSCEKQTPFYLCVVCGNSLSRGLVLLHIQSTRHLQQYLVVCAGEVAVLPDELLQLAGKLEERNLDEPSTMKRIPLPPEDFHSIRTMTFDKALSRLQTIYRNQNQSELLTCVTSKPQRGT
ncbi:hypothetical protein N1851_023440 [Merluccius polli]|uniref:Uncharacterized protein n=1 Tax=Merluccius polli TaxID=89951 RepID=A0AA47MGI3_MERPO|nr:hypothetical protein N1851_023440 [Merluccius polli]